MNNSTARHGPGPKSTPTFAGGRLFTLGMSSIVTAWDAASGKELWQKAGTAGAAELSHGHVADRRSAT